MMGKPDCDIDCNVYATECLECAYGYAYHRGQGELVEWIREHSHSSKDTWHQEIDKDAWQALLEETK